MLTGDRVAVSAHPLQRVGPIAGAVSNPDQDLVGTGDRVRDFGDREDLRPSVLGDDDSAHPASVSRASVDGRTAIPGNSSGDEASLLLIPLVSSDSVGRRAPTGAAPQGAAGDSASGSAAAAFELFESVRDLVRSAEHQAAIQLQLGDALANVVECPMGTLFPAALGEHLGVPPPDELFEARHVDRAVVQVLLDLWQISRQESPVGSDRVAAQRHRARLGNVLFDERQRLGSRLLERDRRGLDLVEQPRAAVHLDDERIHLQEQLVRLMDDQVGAFGDHFELIVGDQRGDLHDHLRRVIEARHLEIHPHQHVATLLGVRRWRR